ncbi:MAG TPA: STAS domain-containing protein [Terriglobia bacterium]|nr:STAS domain-containing protein [Terriglobia bacterium]
MNVAVRQVGDVTILDMEGRLTIGPPVATFASIVEEVLGAGAKKLALNMARLTFVDSSGFGYIMRFYVSTTRIGVKYKLFGVSKLIASDLKVLHLNTVLELYEDEDSVLASFENRG